MSEDAGLHNQNRRVNLVAALIGHCLTLGIGLLFIPFLRDRVGSVEYGKVATANNLGIYVGMLVAALHPAVQKELASVAHGSPQHQEVRTAVLRLSRILGSMLGLIAPIVVVTVLVGLVDYQLGSLLAALVLVSSLHALSVPTDAHAIVTGRAYCVVAAISASNSARVMSAIVLFASWRADLIAYAGALAVGGIFYYLTSRALGRGIVVIAESGHSNGSALKNLVHTASWSGASQIGEVVWSASELLLVQWFFGWEAAGAYALAVHWVGAARGLLWSLTGPPLAEVLSNTAIQAGSEQSGYSDIPLHVLDVWAGITLAVASALCVVAAPLLDIWAGEDVAALHTVTCAGLLGLPATIHWQFSGMVALARNQVRRFSLMNAGSALLLVTIVAIVSSTAGLKSTGFAVVIGLYLRGVVLGPVVANGARGVWLALTIVVRQALAAATGAVATLALYPSGTQGVAGLLLLAFASLLVQVMLQAVLWAPHSRRYARSLLGI